MDPINLSFLRAFLKLSKECLECLDFAEEEDVGILNLAEMKMQLWRWH